MSETNASLGSKHQPAPGAQLVCTLLVVLAGCGDGGSSPTPPPAATPAPRASVALKVLVVNDAALADAVNRLRGEWTERSGGTFVANSKPYAELARATNVDADLLIVPVRYLGELVAAGRIRPMRESVLRSELYAAADVLPLVRQRLATFGGQILALPISVEVPLFDVTQESTPGDRSAAAQPERAPAIWPPRDAHEHWPAVVLLARAAGYASHPRQEAVLFDPQTMAARIAEPPFVRALEEWRQDSENVQKATPQQEGRAAVRLDIPAAAQVYNRSTGEWEPAAGGVHRVPLLAGGTLVAVTAASRNAASAFDLATWLASADVARQLRPLGAGTFPVRRSLVRGGGRLVDLLAGHVDSAQVADVLDTGLSDDEALVVPRIPGTDEYMTALAQAVESALRGEVTPDDALRDAAAKWDQITDRIGRDAQRQAYLKDLGLDEP